MYDFDYDVEDLVDVLVTFKKSYLKHFKKALGMNNGNRYKFKIDGSYNVRIDVNDGKITIRCFGGTKTFSNKAYREFLAEYAYRQICVLDDSELHLNRYQVDNPELIKLIYTICEDPEMVLDSICAEAEVMFTVFSKFDYRLAPNQTKYTKLTLNLSKRDFVVW